MPTNAQSIATCSGRPHDSQVERLAGPDVEESIASAALARNNKARLPPMHLGPPRGRLPGQVHPRRLLAARKTRTVTRRGNCGDDEPDVCILCHYWTDSRVSYCPVTRSGAHIWNRSSQGTVYIMCSAAAKSWRRPRHLEQADQRNQNPASHYCGWTRQENVVNRVRQHGWPATTLVCTFTGTPADEETCKQIANCPHCDERLAQDSFAGKLPAPWVWRGPGSGTASVSELARRAATRRRQ